MVPRVDWVRRPKSVVEQAAPQIERQVTQAPVFENAMITPMGTSGTDAGYAGAAWLELTTGRRVVVASSDDNSRPLRPYMLSDGRVIPVPQWDGGHFVPDTGTRTRRDLVREHELLIERYERTGLLRGRSVSEGYGQAGHGTGADPIYGLMDYDLFPDNYAELYRGGIVRAVPELGEVRQGGPVSRRVVETQPTKRSLFDLAVVNSTGGYGNGLQLVSGYKILKVARDLGIDEVERWLIRMGPTIYKGVSPNWDVNFAAMTQAIDHLVTNGINRPGINREVLKEAAPPWDVVLMVDDPKLASNNHIATEAELAAFHLKVGAIIAALLRPEIRAEYRAKISGKLGEDGKKGFRMATVQMALAGFDPELMFQQLTSEISVQRGEALATLLKSTH